MIGVVNASWSDEIAMRIPDDAHAVIATDANAAGDKYAATILDSLRGRRVEVSRWVP